MRSWIISGAIVANLGVWGAAYVGFTSNSGTSSFMGPKNVINIEIIEMEAIGRIGDSAPTHSVPITVTLLVRDTADIGRICRHARRLKSSFNKTFKSEPANISASRHTAEFGDVKPLLTEAANKTLNRSSVIEVNLTTNNGISTASKKIKKITTIKCAS